MAFPQQRLRRTRRTSALRGLVRETELSPSDFIYPMFVAAGQDVDNEIPSMPGIRQMSINNAVAEAKKVHSLGIPGVLLFGIVMAWNCGVLAESVAPYKIPTLGISEAFKYVPPAMAGVLVAMFSLEHIIAILRGVEVEPAWH